MSGHDLPIKSQEEIHRYFEMNEKNYVAFYRPEMKYDTLFDYKIYHIPFKKYVLIRLSRRIQRFLRIDRIKNQKWSIWKDHSGFQLQMMRQNMLYQKKNEYYWCFLTQDARMKNIIQFSISWHFKYRLSRYKISNTIKRENYGKFKNDRLAWWTRHCTSENVYRGRLWYSDEMQSFVCKKIWFESRFQNHKTNLSIPRKWLKILS